jgi:hypothetical protein
MRRPWTRRTVGFVLAASLATTAACTAESGDGPAAVVSSPVETTIATTPAPVEDGSPTSGPVRPNADPDERNDDQWQDVAGRVGPDPSPPAPNAAACIADASLPLAEVEVAVDPLAELRSARTASVYGSVEPLDDVVTFDSFDDYPDPSTPYDLDAIVQAWEAAGFEGGVAAKRQDGWNLVMATVVAFRTPADARDAVAVHLTDLCHGSVRSERHPDGAGMSMVRTSGAVRSVGAVGRYEVSLFACVCVGADDVERSAAVEDWRRFLIDRWATDGTGEYAGNERV